MCSHFPTTCTCCQAYKYTPIRQNSSLQVVSLSACLCRCVCENVCVCVCYTQCLYACMLLLACLSVWSFFANNCDDSLLISCHGLHDQVQQRHREDTYYPYSGSCTSTSGIFSVMAFVMSGKLLCLKVILIRSESGELSWEFIKWNRTEWS